VFEITSMANAPTAANGCAL